MAEELSVGIAVEKEEVYVGESFVMQIQVKGHDTPDKPDVSGIVDFKVQEAGSRQNSSSSMSIINGRMTRNVSRGYIFSYKLTPKRAGRLSIPSFKVVAGGKSVRTQVSFIKAIKPVETDDFKLMMKLSTDKCYVGQPITLDVTWYIGKDVEKYQFNLPVLSDKRFDVVDFDIPIDPRRRDKYISIPVEDTEIYGIKEKGTFDGREFLTVHFKKILIPKTSGTLEIPQGTVTCNARVGYKNSRRTRDPFDSFFGRRRRAIYKKFVVPSNRPVLNVSDLPKKNRPDGFTGLIGRYNIIANATPTEVNVGDPITLNIVVSGPDYLENVELTGLHQQSALTGDFKIPVEMAPGKVEGNRKTFTQTFRAKHPDVQMIPPIELPYFDAEKGKYAVARTKPIPLTVKATRVVTAMDAEGHIVAEETKTELESWAEGIAHNYEDLSALENQDHGPFVWIDSPLWMALIGLPPMIYLVLLGGVVIIRKHQADPAAREARQAYSELVAQLNKLRKKPPSNSLETFTQLLEAIRRYLGSKLRLSAGALTFKDVELKLHNNGVLPEVTQALRKVFDQSEAGRYAGGSNAEHNVSSIIEDILVIAKKLERKLK